ncbi:uncharacterized protein LOC124861619 isoform X2 [Girardinichthys multiradiatus]|uniref:uncharacterized protein LOC124861619 isoform X2 n=1 Tax=Girardinichthys multiradiatus TaxID=208333 RepID=UPI001FAE11DB|nr:uncharacterized protein LOC124861619 isoform X2 [Girardinichthys multiradiatus]
MCRCKLWLVFLLWLTLYSYNIANTGQQLVKTISKEADFTPVCGNYTLNVTIFVICKISEEKCNLTYHRIKGFKQGCDSRFSLIPINQTLFLQLNNLTPENSGNYTCQCTARHGTFILQLNITVVDDEDTSHSSETTLISYVGVFVLIIIVLLGVIAGFIYRTKCYRRRHEVTVTTHTNTVLYTKVEDIEPDAIFKENELYLTSIIHTSTSTNNLIGVGVDNRSLGIPL